MVELGLTGYPLGHSFSPAYFENKFRRLGITGSYSLFPLKNIGMLPLLITEHPDLSGLNVTVPYKRQVLPYLDRIDAAAAEIGAVNTIKITRADGSKCFLEGYNTDWKAFAQSLKSRLRPEIQRALVLGTGGAAHAVAYALAKLGLKSTFVSRQPEKSHLQPAISYNRVGHDTIASHLLIVNTTPVGMYPKEDACPEIPYEHITSSHMLYDLIYNPEVTLFMKKGIRRGAVVCNGMEMLHRQADLAWEIWNE